MATKKFPEPIFAELALARAAGLTQAAQQFPEDVAAAVRSAVQAQSALGAPASAAAEPWPPMRMRGLP